MHQLCSNGQRVLSGLRLISVYLDDVTVYSETLAEYVINHIIIVFEHSSLKLNPAKCRFVCDELEYLGYLITPAGLKPSKYNPIAVREFPVLINLRHLQQILGQGSHYKRFIYNCTKKAYLL